MFNGGTGVMIQINRSTANCVYITELRKRRRNYLAAEKIMRNKRVISFSIAFPLFFVFVISRTRCILFMLWVSFSFCSRFLCFLLSRFFFVVSTFVNSVFFCSFICKENIKHRHSCVNINWYTFFFHCVNCLLSFSDIDIWIYFTSSGLLS